MAGADVADAENTEFDFVHHDIIPFCFATRCCLVLFPRVLSLDSVKVIYPFGILMWSNGFFKNYFNPREIK